MGDERLGWGGLISQVDTFPVFLQTLLCSLGSVKLAEAVLRP